MYSKVNYTIVGIFVLLFSVGLVWFAFWLAKYGIHREFDTYKLLMTESVSGLSKDSVVKLRGVDIGRVSEIRIDPNNIERIEVFLKIKRGVPIKENMVAYTQMLGVTGLLSIEIGGGSNHAKTLEPTEDYIPIIPTAPSWFTKTREGLGTLSDRITLLVDSTQKLLNEKNIVTLGKVIDNTEVFTAKAEDLEDKAMHSLDEVDSTLQNFRDSMKNINVKLAQLTQDFNTMQRDFSGIKKVTIPTINKLMQTTKDFRRVTLKVEKSLGRGDYNFKKILSPVLIEVQMLSKELRILSRQLSQNPSALLFKSRKSRKGPGE